MMKIAKLTKTLAQRVERGEWPQGNSLPSRNHLSEEYGVSPTSVSIAIRNLEKEGLVRIVPRKGVFVVERRGISTEGLDTIRIGLRGNYVPGSEEVEGRSIETVFGQAIFNGIWENAWAKKCPLLLLPGTAEEAPLTAEACASAGIRGVIFLGGESYEEALTLRNSGFPVILGNRPVGGTPINFVDFDAKHELKSIIQRFISLGHRRIGVICPASASVPGYYQRLRLDYLDIMDENGTFNSPSRFWRYVPRWPSEANGEPMDAVLKDWFNSADAPTAIFCWQPILASLCAKNLSDLRLSIPNDVSIACSGYLDTPSQDKSAFSGFVMPHQQLGATLIEELHASILNPFHCVQKLIPCEYVDRGSIMSPKE